MPSLFALLVAVLAGLIVALAIPLSMLFAFSGMLQFGIAAGRETPRHRP